MTPAQKRQEAYMTATVTTRPAVSVAGLRKTFDAKVVLDGIDLTVTEGTVFALLGPNGAGKTTMVRILATLLPPDSGSIRVAGHDLAGDPEAVRAAIGLTGQFAAVDRLLTVQENLRLMAGLHRLGRAEGRRRVATLIERFDLGESARKPVSLLSGGQQRRLDLAMTLVGDPRLIFLDEPTTGLDPRSRHAMWQIVRELVAEGVTIFLTTQYLDEADQLADRIAVLDQGRIVVEGTPDELKRRIPGGHLLLRFTDPESLRTAAAALDTTHFDDSALTLQVPSDGDVASLRAVLATLDRVRVEPDNLTIHTPDLDDVFFTFTGAPATTVEESR
jgi:ABC-2 type transport system ATP-binding protein